MTQLAASPFILLLHTNVLQGWRKLRSASEHSRLMTTVVILFVGGYSWLSWFLFYKGLRFVQRFPGLDTLMTERLLYLLFAFLFALLLFSNLIISYTNLFRNRETNFLLSLPVPRETILRWKLLESTTLASWAFLFLIAPLLVAYGMTYQLPWHFYLVTILLIGLFIVLPAAFGTFAAVLLARFLDRRAFQIALIGSGLVALALIALYFKPEPISDEMLETRVLAVLDRMLIKTRFAQFPFLPSYWLTGAVINYAEGALSSTLFFVLVLFSNGLFFGFLAVNAIARFFYDALSEVSSRGSVLGNWRWFRKWEGARQRVAMRASGLETVVRLLPFLRDDVRALIVKDARVFWRDTTQWGQTLVLFGLLAAYIINLRHFTQQLTNPFWVDLVSYLNLGACSLNLATLTTRFVYPQFSLEGKRLWIVGLAPLGLPAVVRTKLLLASIVSLVITETLIITSCRMLKMPLDRTLFFALAIGIMTVVLNGLAIGLGVLYPNFKEDNPSKIVSGFGGTFCLIVSFLYILACVVLLALGAPWAKGGAQTLQALFLSWTGFAALTLLIGWLPLKAAFKKLQTIEI
jgi:ABC-2 type transport system permease protein